jgi:opacity protein-like surface antigen
MKKFMLFALILLLFALNSPLWAEVPKGFYVGAKAGIGIIHTATTVLGGSGYTPAKVLRTRPFSYSLNPKNTLGFLAGINVGYDLEKVYSIPIRFELEYSYRFGGEANWNGQQSILDATNAAIPVSLEFKSRLSSQTLLLNFYYDIPTGTRITPYLGVGAGLGIVKAKDSGIITIEDATPASGIFNKSQTIINLAWNLAGGLSYDITENETIDLGYRFASARKIAVPEIIHVSGDNVYIPVDSVHKNVYSHDITIAIRHTF